MTHLYITEWLNNEKRIVVDMRLSGRTQRSGCKENKTINILGPAESNAEYVLDELWPTQWFCCLHSDAR